METLKLLKIKLLWFAVLSLASGIYVVYARVPEYGRKHVETAFVIVLIKAIGWIKHFSHKFFTLSKKMN